MDKDAHLLDALKIKVSLPTAHPAHTPLPRLIPFKLAEEARKNVRLEGERRRLMEDVKRLRQHGSVPPSPRNDAKAIHQLRAENKALEAALQQSKTALMQYQAHMSALQARLQGSEATMQILSSHSAHQQQQLFHMQRSVSQNSLAGGGRSRTSSVRSYTSDYSLNNRADEMSLSRIQGSAGGSPTSSVHPSAYVSNVAAEDRTFVTDTRLIAAALSKSLEGAMSPGHVNCAISLKSMWDGTGNPFLFHLNRIGFMLIPKLVNALVERIGRANMVLVGGSAWNAYLTTPLDTDDVDFTVRSAACPSLYDHITSAVVELLNMDDVCTALASLQQVGEVWKERGWGGGGGEH